MALLAGVRSPPLEAQVGDDGAPYIEATILQLQELMRSRRLTSRELTVAYLRRIERLNPTLGAVIETNPEAVAIAEHLDRERRTGHTRGPLHGIPVLVKDNIATDDLMQTTAGSLALVNSRVPADAKVVRRLRKAGAVILGKTNLSEWANFRGFTPLTFNGWSARGGFTRDPYVLSYDTCGSSSGSAVAVAANLCAAAIGTETDGSIVCPSGNNLIVGLKPTLGLVSQDGIIPIAHSQDTAGPMTRTVTDAAILLNVLQKQSGDDDDGGDDDDRAPPVDYTRALRRGALRGARIGVDRRYFTNDLLVDPAVIPVVNHGLDVMRRLGARIVDTDTGDPFEFADAEFTALLFEFKVQIADYLARLRHTRMRTLADLIAFNRANCPKEMKYYGQEIFELSEATSGNLSDPEYVSARALSVKLAKGGIDQAMGKQDLDAIVAPSYSFASSPAAIAGYPNVAVPIGLTANNTPAGIWMYGRFQREAKLLSLAFDLEQEIQPRRKPRLLGSVPPEPPDAGICGSLPHIRRADASSLRQMRHLGTGKRFFSGS
jgi:amidase